MKKILLSLMLIGAFAIVRAQLCGAGAIRTWVGTVQPWNPGGLSQAPIVINGLSADWEQYISGPFAYSGSPKNTYETNPYPSPIAAANIQRDGLKGAPVGVDYDLDDVGQVHRDLRYFAFTYDIANVYFFFRRPANNTAQVSLYYFIDKNVDGWMANGEPVIKITFNNSGSSIEMGYYTAVNSNGTAAGSYDAIKGNIMTAPVARAKTGSQSGWVVGIADGWNMPGTYNTATGLPALTNVSGVAEVFKAETLVDNFSDGSEGGFGVEFAVPWKYFATFTGGAFQAGTSLNYTSIFTWHVSLVGGNSGISGAEDNAGGCCSGLGVSGTAEVSKSGFWEKTSADPYHYRLNLSFTNLKAYQTNVVIGGIKIIDPKDALGNPLSAANLSNWTLTGYKNPDCIVGNGDDADAVTFTYSGSSGTTHSFVSSDLIKSTATVAAAPGPAATACYYINFNAFSFPPVKSADVEFDYSTVFDISSGTCDNLQSGVSSGTFSVLPVKITYFNAARSGQNVNLTWQTSIEENSKGFEVQRFIGTAGWETIGFIPSQAVNGSSSSALNYQFTDLNNTTKGITQYRLKEVDKDNHAAYSVIRSVRGEGQKSNTIIYPNPSGDGKINIVFDGTGTLRDLSLMDASGKTLKQWKGVTNNNIHIENLNAGFYTVRIVNVETGEQLVEKFIVNKR